MMATLRTKEEKSAILAHCLELEKTGGDILAYLRSQNYLTPRATWINYQREKLRRKPHEFTDGKPRKDGMKMPEKRTISDEIKQAAISAYFAGGSPCTVLKDAGVKNPSSTWFNIKKKLQKEQPEIAAKIANGKPGPKPKTEQMPVVKLSGPIKIETEEPEKVEIAAADKEWTKYKPETEAPKKPEVYLTGPGWTEKEVRTLEEMNGVKAKVINPLRFNVTAIETEYGEFYHDKKFGCIDWRNLEGDEVSMKIGDWKQLANELPEILQALGVDA